MKLPLIRGLRWVLMCSFLSQDTFFQHGCSRALGFEAAATLESSGRAWLGCALFVQMGVHGGGSSSPPPPPGRHR